MGKRKDTFQDSVEVSSIVYQYLFPPDNSPPPCRLRKPRSAWVVVCNSASSASSQLCPASFWEKCVLTSVPSSTKPRIIPRLVDTADSRDETLSPFRKPWELGCRECALSAGWGSEGKAPMRSHCRGTPALGPSLSRVSGEVDRGKKDNIPYLKRAAVASPS